MSHALNWVQGALIWGALLGALVFLGLYVGFAQWQRSPLGRHMMWLAAMFAAILGLAVLGRYAPDLPGRPWIRLATYGVMAFMMWRQVWLLTRALWRRPPDRRSPHG